MKVQKHYCQIRYYVWSISLLVNILKTDQYLTQVAIRLGFAWAVLVTQLAKLQNKTSIQFTLTI